MPKGIVHPRAVFHPNLILDTMPEVARENNLEFRSAPDNLEGVGDWELIHCALQAEDMVANFQLQQMPGCCAVLTASYIKPVPYTQENFDRVLQWLEDASFRAGFGSLMLTQCVPSFTRSFWKQEPWIKCLDKGRGWVASDPFRNAKSGNLVVYLTKNLGHKRQVAGLEFDHDPRS